MPDFLRIHVLWAPASEESARVAELISRHFDGIGMERDGVAHRIPVRFRSEPWAVDGGAPRPVALDDAVHNVVVLLHDGSMDADRATWEPFVKDLCDAMAKRPGLDAYVPFGDPDGLPGLPRDRATVQYARRDRWKDLAAAARDVRLLLHLVFAIREHLRRSFGRDGEVLFVSHAKADGDATARAIVDYVNATDQDVPLRAFYDAKELSPGDDFGAEFVRVIKGGTLLAIVSDVYDSRPWCVFELTTAKRAGRPIVLADVGQVRTSRTFPYGANLPRVRVSLQAESTEWIEPLLLETLSEGLRCDTFLAQASRAAEGADMQSVLVLPRPPELLDVFERLAVGAAIVYPDPPLARLEADILAKALAAVSPLTRLLSLSEVA